MAQPEPEPIDKMLRITSALIWRNRMARRKTLPSKITKLVFQEAQSQCPFCKVAEVSALEIHHITSVAAGGSDTLDNLIVVCSNCHSQITAGDISEAEVRRMKIRLMNRRPGEGETSQHGIAPSHNVVNFTGGVNYGIVAGSLNYKGTTKPRVKVARPEGSIGADLDRLNYSKYLIQCYHEFKKMDPEVQTMRYQVIYKSIEREFGASWDCLPIERFEALVEYLQHRIDSTRMGKGNRSRGIPNYKSFAEHVSKVRR